jgi:hypothetical protein
MQRFFPLALLAVAAPALAPQQPLRGFDQRPGHEPMHGSITVPVIRYGNRADDCRRRGRRSRFRWLWPVRGFWAGLDVRSGLMSVDHNRRTGPELRVTKSGAATINSYGNNRFPKGTTVGPLTLISLQ